MIHLQNRLRPQTAHLTCRLLAPLLDSGLVTAGELAIIRKNLCARAKTGEMAPTVAPKLIRGVSPAEAEDKAVELLKRVGLADKANAYPGQLSGGQKQRIAIVRSLAMQPRVMLFDEPTSALDPEMVGEVLQVMRDLAEEHMTMITVTHELSFAREIASRMLFIDGGKIAVDKPTKEFFGEIENQRLRDFISKVL